MPDHEAREAAEAATVVHERAPERDVTRPHGATGVRVQRRLLVGAADDPAEREADQIADRVIAAMRSGTPTPTAAVTAAPGTRIARRATGADGFEVDHDTHRAIQSARGGGQALPSKIRRSMEGAFGADFSDIRLHVGARSDALNERVQARAFTLGNDVFVRRADYAPGTSAGQHLLAHELAHTVQQGASRVQRRGLASGITPTSASTAQRVIRRLTATEIVDHVTLDQTRELTAANAFDPAAFKEKTNTRGHQRGAALKAIDKYLVQYAPLKNATDPAKQQQQLDLLVQMQYAAEQWILDHSVEDSGGNRGALKKDKNGVVEAETGDVIIDPKRKGRFSGMAYFLKVVNAQIRAVKAVLANTDDDATTLQNVEQSGATAGHSKLKAKYDGDPTSVFTKLGALIEMAVPNEGDASEIEVAFRWPVDPTGVAFVGGTIRLKAQNSSPPGTTTGAQGKKNLLARAEILFTFGAQWLDVGKIQAEIGGYIESSAKTGRETMTLMSYMLYRKAAESYVFPQGVINYMWGGGRKGMFGQIKADMWSRDVEKGIIGDNENAYVQSGLVGGVGAEGKLGNRDIGMAGNVKLSGGLGTRYDKESIEKVKGVGGLGNKNERSDKAKISNAQKQLGRGVRFLALEVAGNVGPFNGAAAVRLQWEQGQTGYEIKAAELEFQAGAKVPNVGGEDFGTRVAGWVTEGVKTLVSKVRAVVGSFADKEKVAKGEITQKERNDARVGSGTGETWTTVLDGLDQLRNMSGIESTLTPNPAVDPTWLGGAAPTSASSFHDVTTSNSQRLTESIGNRAMQSTIGLMLAIGGDIIGRSMQISINFEKARSFAIPMFLEVSQKSTSRLIAFRLENKTWSVL